jgi:hypothetical protein
LKSEAKALFWMGDFKQARFKADGFFPKGMQLTSGEPYMVQKVPATAALRRYGLVSITVAQETLGFGCGQKLPVLSVKPGVVQYFGDFTLSHEGDDVVVKHSFDISTAQTYLDKKYPQQKWKLEVGTVEPAKAVECPKGPYYIYIQVPAF